MEEVHQLLLRPSLNSSDEVEVQVLFCICSSLLHPFYAKEKKEIETEIHYSPIFRFLPHDRWKLLDSKCIALQMVSLSPSLSNLQTSNMPLAYDGVGM